MGNLIRMDLYRMRRSKAFLVSLILAAASALLMTPAAWGLAQLANLLGETKQVFPESVALVSAVSDPFPMLNAMIGMLAACTFFFSDLEFGYIKNIAGQMPKKGYTVLSKFIAVMVQNALFMAVGIACSLLGTVFFQRIALEGDYPRALLTLLLKFLLMQACCTILLLLVSAVQNKSLGSVMAVLMGSGLLSLVYMGIDAGLRQFIRMGAFSIAQIMPDQLLRADAPKTADALLVSAVTIGVFLPLAIRVFDRRDVK